MREQILLSENRKLSLRNYMEFDYISIKKCNYVSHLVLAYIVFQKGKAV